jgi:AraC-like DNA-binding protein
VEELIAYLRQRAYHCLHSKSHAVSPAVSGNLHLLFTLPAKQDMEMDTAIYGPVTELVTLYRRQPPPAGETGPGHAARELVTAVQQLVVQQVANALWPHPQELAEAFAVHPKKLRRLFLAVAGCSLQAYIGDVRMEEAWRRLTEEKQEPTAVAFGLGYQEQAAFYHQFKKHFGITPGEAHNGMPSKSKKLYSKTYNLK